MSEFRILDASNPDDRAFWLDVWSSWQEREPHAHPGYLSLFEIPGQRSLCVFFADQGGGVLFPFHIRDLGIELWCPAEVKASDFVSPYGYGGPYFWGTPSSGDFWANFSSWTKASRVATGFFRCSLFPEQVLPLPVGETIVMGNVVRTLNHSAETLWMDAEHKVRKNVNKARRAGLRCFLDPDVEHLQEFLQIYRSTMARRQASDFYHFDDDFFETLAASMPGIGRYFHVSNKDGEVISSELVLVSTDHIYSFLGGTTLEGMSLGANDLLKHGIIDWGREEGKAAFVLGGGFRPDDGIFRYKQAFAPGGMVPFMVGKWVTDQSLSDELVEARRSWEQSQGRDWEPLDGFFPPYRAAGKPSQTA